MSISRLGKSIGRAVSGIPLPVKIIAAIAAVLLVTPMLQSAYAGGWEVTAQLESLKVEDMYATRVLASNVKFDPDGQWIHYLEPVGHGDDPDIVVEKSLVYKIRQSTAMGWVATEDSNLVDYYDVPEGDVDEFTRYHHWTFGLDITIKTDADTYYKERYMINPDTGNTIDYFFRDFGWYYEANVVEAEVWTQFSITPWTPAGEDGSYDVTGGWSGVLSASVYKRSFGLVEETAIENQGHTITDIHSVNAPLNMDVTSTDFRAGAGSLENVPSAVSIETKATLGAGAKYTTDALGHWDSCAVRNVFVKYQIRIDVLTVLNYELKTGHQGELEDPDEENTAYAPENTALMGLFELLTGGGGWIMQLAVIVVLGIFGVIILKVILGLRRSGQ